MDDAAAHAGIAYSTLASWNARGRRELERTANGEKPDPKEAPFVEILEAVEKARAEATVRNVTLISRAAQDGTWQAAAWWLERTQPRKYGRRTEVTGPDGGPMEHNVTVADLEATIAGLLGEGEPDEQRP
jgi:transposase